METLKTMGRKDNENNKGGDDVPLPSLRLKMKALRIGVGNTCHASSGKDLDDAIPSTTDNPSAVLAPDDSAYALAAH